MLFKSGLLTQASGSLGGATFSRNSGGMYVRSRAVPVNVNSAAQVVVRDAMAELTHAWANELTEVERDAWDTYAFNVPLVGPLGDSRQVSGIAQYVRSNVPRLMAGLARVDAAPTTFTVGPAITVAGATLTVSTGTGTITATLPWIGSSANGDVLVQTSRPVNASLQYFRGPFQFLGSAANEASPFTDTDAAIYAGLAVGQAVFFRIRRTQDDGRLGPETILKVAVTAVA